MKSYFCCVFLGSLLSAYAGGGNFNGGELEKIGSAVGRNGTITYVELCAAASLLRDGRDLDKQSVNQRAREMKNADMADYLGTIGVCTEIDEDIAIAFSLRDVGGELAYFRLSEFEAARCYHRIFRLNDFDLSKIRGMENLVKYTVSRPDLLNGNSFCVVMHLQSLEGIEFDHNRLWAALMYYDFLKRVDFTSEMIDQILRTSKIPRVLFTREYFERLSETMSCRSTSIASSVDDRSPKSVGYLTPPPVLRKGTEGEFSPSGFSL